MKRIGRNVMDAMSLKYNEIIKYEFKALCNIMLEKIIL